jgi:hypothetical protein
MRNFALNHSNWMAGLLCLLLISGCIEFRQIALYDAEEKVPPPVKPKSVDQVVSPILFEDDTLDIWGIVSDSCKEFVLTDEVTFEGEKALKLKWSRYGCEWVGFGMGWDGYAGKDLTRLIDYAAFEMYVRTQEGKMYGLPMVFTLEDYSSIMAFAYTGNKYFERAVLDEEWQKVVVPLSSFNDEGKGIDYTNIKQLQIEMQQSGAVYVDEIRLVFHEPAPPEVWVEEEKLPDPTILPQTLFEDDFVNGNGWGMITDDCQNFKMTESETYAGSKAIELNWDADAECELVSFGVNWHKWRPIDITEMKDKAVLRYYLKADNPADLDFTMVLQGFDGSGAIAVDWNTKYAGSKNAAGWYEVKVPMADFDGSVDQTRIQHIVFEFSGKGKAFIDQMSWIAK